MNDNFFNLRKARRHIVAASVIVVMLIAFVACNKDNNDSSRAVYDPNKPVELTSFTPDSGRISEMVLLDGNNFGTDTSKIRVFFNAKQARVLSSTGTRILTFVPRLPGDTCVVSVVVDGKKVSYTDFFRYKVSATATTIAGDGTYAIREGALDQSRLVPVYIGVDKDDNIFVVAENNSGMLLKLNIAENTMVTIGTNAQGIAPRLQPTSATSDNMILLGGEGTGSRDWFSTLDPKEGWVPKLRFIKDWKLNGYDLPGDSENHFQCLYCATDGYYYSRYGSGALVKIHPKTWEAEIIYRTDGGAVFGMAFHPVRQNELWLGYEYRICILDVTNPAETYRTVSNTISGHRDGPLEEAQFNGIRQINFDAEGNLFVGDNGNHCIRRIDTDNMVVTTVIGIPGIAGFKDGSQDEALFSNLHGIATDSNGIVYASDYGNRRVRRIAIE
jgi:hypothetical protein